MIIWNCQKVNHSNSAQKPLPRLHNVPKVAFLWDIFIFQAFGTSWSTGKFQVAYLWLETIEENLRKFTKIDPLRIPFDTLTPQLYPKTLPNTLRHLILFPMSPRSGPDHSHALVRQLESQRLCISIKFLRCWPMYSSCKKSPMRLPSKSEGHRCLKYQNVPYIRNFWHIGKPWERFQHWVRLIYFLTVPDDHTVLSFWHFC